MTVATLGSRTLFRPEPAAAGAGARLVPQVSAQFAAAVVATLSAGLLGLLWINTALAEDAYRVHELRQEARAATEQEQAVERAVQDLRSPASLAARASALGMVAAGPPAFLLLEDGTVQGQPQPAVGAPADGRPEGARPVGVQARRMSRGADR